mgnify:CR=1 FL=1
MKLEERIQSLEEGSCMDAIVLPLHGSLPPELQASLSSPWYCLFHPHFATWWLLPTSDSEAFKCYNCPVIYLFFSFRLKNLIHNESLLNVFNLLCFL